METDVITCPRCHVEISEKDYFCPNCGQKIKEPTFPITFGKIVTVYLLSLLVPPTGYYYGMRYRKSADEKTRKVGNTAIALTTISILLTIVSIIIGIKIATNLINMTNMDLPADYQNFTY